MKSLRITLILLLINFNLMAAQTTVVFNHTVVWEDKDVESIEGEVEVNEKDKTIRIKTNQGFKYYKFKDVKEVVEPDGTVVWSYEAYNKRLTQNACLYGICGAVIVYTLVLNHLLKDFGMDKG